MKSLGKLLNEIIASHPGQEVAELIGKSPAHVSQIRKGTNTPSEETLAIIAQAYAPKRLPELLLAAAIQRAERHRYNGTEACPGRELKSAAVEALKSLSTGSEPGPVKDAGRTFDDFPDAFYPLVVVTGDKRETRGSHITVADFGAYAATPADTRWICNLGLRADVVKHIDKNFVLLPEDRLMERFAETNLLVVGSPAANHLARRVNRSAVFRFNESVDAIRVIEDQVASLKEATRDQLAAAASEQERRDTLARTMRALFVGGIIDPTSPPTYAAAQFGRIAVHTQLDFGVLTFAANPFYEMKCRTEGKANDHRYVAIMAAGIHHPATAHALKLLGADRREEGVFEKHPYGGVIRVDLDIGIPFAERTEVANCLWEDVADDQRSESDDQKADLLRELEMIEQSLKNGGLRNLELTADQARACRELIEKL